MRIAQYMLLHSNWNTKAKNLSEVGTVQQYRELHSPVAYLFSIFCSSRFKIEHGRIPMWTSHTTHSKQTATKALLILIILTIFLLFIKHKLKWWHIDKSLKIKFINRTTFNTQHYIQSWSSIFNPAYVRLARLLSKVL